MNIRKFFRPVILVAALLASASLYAQNYTRCWMKSINGYEQEHSRALETIKGTTGNDLTQFQAYITAKRFPGEPNPFLYVHTNFKPIGQENALKLSFAKTTLDQFFDRDPVDLQSLISATLRNEDVTGAEDKLSRSAKIFIDTQCYDLFPDLRVGDIKDVFSIPKVGELLPQMELKTKDGKVRRLSKIAPPPPGARVYVSERLAALPSQFTALADMPFSKRDVTLISVVKDSTTESLLSKLPNEQRTVRSDFTKEQFLETLKEQASKMQFILGHVKNGELYLTPDGKVSIALSDIEKYAEQEKLSIGIVGCESGVSDSGIVVSKFINSATAASQFIKAIEAKNFLEFFQTFSCAELEIVINESTIAKVRELQKVTARGHLYGRDALAKGKQFPKEQGVITIIAGTGK